MAAGSAARGGGSPPPASVPAAPPAPRERSRSPAPASQLDFRGAAWLPMRQCSAGQHWHEDELMIIAILGLACKRQQGVPVAPDDPDVCAALVDSGVFTEVTPAAVKRVLLSKRAGAACRE
jgi:hypothetical protein